MRRFLLPVAFVAIASLLSAQPTALTTTYAGGNGQSGNMFDVDATIPIDIVQFDISLDAGITSGIEVYVITGGGSYVGNETSAANWSLVATFPSITSAGTDVPTPLPPLPAPISLVPGTVQGIYITVNTGTGMSYTNGTTEGTLFATDGTLNFYEGRGASYPFGGTFVPRVWNGTIYYLPSGTLTPEFQPNSDLLRLEVDGAGGNEFFPFVSNYDVFPQCGPVAASTAEISMSSNVAGTLYDLAISSSPVKSLSQGAVNLPGLRFGIDILQPYTFVGSLGLLPEFGPMPGVGIPGITGSEWRTLVALPTVASTLTLQGVSIDPSSPSGLGGTAPAQIDVTPQPPAASVNGPNNTSTNISVDVTTAPTCWALGGIPFYGTLFNEVFVSPNGFVCFGAGGDTDTTPSVLDALNDDGRVGFWTSFDPSEGGTIDVLNLAPNLIRVQFNAVSYDGLAGATTGTFAIEIDASLGTFTVDGLQGIQANPGTSTTDDQWLGISPGVAITGLTATDPGGTPFTPGGSGGVAAPGDMIYEFNDTSVSGSGLPASLVSGVNTLFFTPDGSGNYTWASF